MGSAKTVLEIGCGSGDVAAELSRAGFHVVALDEDRESVAAALGRGVDARIASWPAQLQETSFDAVAFTRSIHHIPDLPAALERAAGLLPARGILAIEDFDYRDADPRLIRWAASRIDAVRPLLDPESFAMRLALADDPLAVWRGDHDEHLHGFAAIEAEVGLRFEIVELTQAPYVFRYLESAGITDQRILAAAEREEISAARQHSFPLLGRRLVARR